MRSNRIVCGITVLLGRRTPPRHHGAMAAAEAQAADVAEERALGALAFGASVS